MGIWDRLGKVINSYLHNEEETIFRAKRQTNAGDPDFDAAYDELNEFLNKDKTENTDKRENTSNTSSTKHKQYAPPETLRPDFAELGVPFGASADECKESYKKLMKIHHPDRHAGHEGNFAKATAKSARINASYERINAWRVKPP